MNARSHARFYAMLPNGGMLDGVRLLSKDRVRTFNIPGLPIPGLPATTIRWMAGPITGPSAGDTSRVVPAWAPWAATRWLSAITGPAAVWVGLILGIGWQLPSSTTAWVPHGPPDESPLEPIGVTVRKALGIPDQLYC